MLEFPPLPPSPVEEADEENSDVGQNAVISTRSKSHGNRTMEYRPRVPPHRGQIVDAKDHQTSLNTRSMDAGFSRGRRTPAAGNSRREVPFPFLCSFFSFLFSMTSGAPSNFFKDQNRSDNEGTRTGRDGRYAAKDNGAKRERNSLSR